MAFRNKRRLSKKIDTRPMAEKLDDVRQRMYDIESSFENRITERPVESMGIAFGAGAVAGALAWSMMKRR